MRAFVVTAPREFEVQEVEAPTAGAGQVVVDVRARRRLRDGRRVLHRRDAVPHRRARPLPDAARSRVGGTVVSAVGDGVDQSWLGRRVTGDTMLGCGACRRCTQGSQHVCADRFEVGIRRRLPGALAEQLAVPASSLHALPDRLDAAAGALVEPGGNALRSVRGAALAPGDRAAGAGPGTIGLLVALFARAQGARCTCSAARRSRWSSPRGLGFAGIWTAQTLPDLAFDAVVEATNGAEHAGRWPSTWSSRPDGSSSWGCPARRAWSTPGTLALKDVTAVGILSGSAGPRRRHRATTPTEPSTRARSSPPRSGSHDVGAVLAGNPSGRRRARTEDPRRPTP